MPIEFTRILPRDPVIPARTITIAPGDQPSGVKTVPPAVGASMVSTNPFVNASRNSRTTNRLPKCEWMVGKSAQLALESRPKYVLHTGDSVVVQGDGPWELFNGGLRFVSKGYLYASDVLLSPYSGRMFAIDEDGMIEARSLQSGKVLFSAPLIFGWVFFRSLMVEVGNRMVIVSTERREDRDAPQLPTDSTIEVLEFTEPSQIDPDGILQSSRITSEIMVKSLRLKSAFVDDTLVAATVDQICLLDTDLNIRTSLVGEFDPISLSLEDSEKIYMIGSVRGAIKLFVVSFNGALDFTVELPPAMHYRSYPAIIGFAGNSFVLGESGMIAFDWSGNPSWEYRPADKIAGAIITPDNDLIFCCGSELGVFDSAGNYRRLYEFKGETLQTPPVLTEKGELLAATDQKLYCLTPVNP